MPVVHRQNFVISQQFPECIILYYMDDFLLRPKDSNNLDRVLKATIAAVKEAGFDVQQEKTQFTSPWNYLGLRIQEQTVTPQQAVRKTNPKALNEVQQLYGSINWIRPPLGISLEDLAPLFSLLRGSSEPNSPRSLRPEAQAVIIQVQEALLAQQAHRYEPWLPFLFLS